MFHDQNLYYKFISERNYIREFDNYEISHKKTAKSLVPWDSFKKEFNDSHNDVKEKINELDYCIIKLLEWFKNDFFNWFDGIKCEKCGCDCIFLRCKTKPDALCDEFYCHNIEVYNCDDCGKQFEFPRYNHAGKLLLTRKGRCGEWALTFAYLSHVFGYQIRIVCHFDDHVWVEVYSENRAQWIHCDPCENVFDNPLLYECGWNKPSTLIIAYGMHEVRDVTWRYTSRWKQTTELRRKLFNEKLINKRLNSLNQLLQKDLSKDLIENLERNWIGEVTQFLRMPNEEVLAVDPKALQCRSSGSIEWRLCRGELNSKNLKHSFRLDDFQEYLSKSNGIIIWTIAYDCAKDSYLNSIENSEKIQKSIEIEHWFNGCFEAEKIFRKVEKDWKMCYLSREEQCSQEDIGAVRWRFFLAKHFNYKSIEIDIRGQTFDNASIELEFIFGSYRKQFSLNTIVKIDWNVLIDKINFETEKFYFEIEGKLLHGTGNLAWQQAQLFRSKLDHSGRNDFFRVSVYFD
ncbi:Peptide-N(4)-(N-acetyl-beta-glucosaminyl)asparagine amidase [Sarcoptes scabiei]|uniref:Peptide-N(4)-(N-acetyl-beta-glucosaminyl)asparagine amidase n=1 Tax=Sarcoptes scabiei TaxID=52283 RepID=A0A834RG40_SARSC|nr:Peptide-N(4)-(N-acetyl-beta-glucosaminyl)asparagine amidase [Sarcoptes scabiei]UXI16400.1 steroid receptor seven-up [Sarcoptes scabiei]